MKPIKGLTTNLDNTGNSGLASLYNLTDLVFHYDRAGNLTHIGGLDKMKAIINDNFPQELATTFLQLLEKENELWTDRFLMAKVSAGNNLKVGDQWSTEMPISPPGYGTLMYQIGIRIFGWDTIKGRRCLIYETKSYSDDPGLSKMGTMMGDFIKTVLAMVMPELSENVPEGSQKELDEMLKLMDVGKLITVKSVSDKTSRAIDPINYLTYLEQRVQVITMEFEQENGSKTTTTIEEIYSHDYQYN